MELSDRSHQERASALLGGDRRALAPRHLTMENEAPDAPVLLAAFTLSQVGVISSVSRVHRAQGSHARKRPGSHLSRCRRDCRHHRRRSHQPILGRGTPGGPGCVCAICRRSRCFHPQHGDPRQLGGLARHTHEAIQVLDAAGFTRILVETVGVGQAEVDIAGAAHTTIVVETPGLGDEVQTMKAGVLEIADLLVVNKAT